MVSRVARTKERSGSWWLLSGVGTQMMMTSASGMREKSVVAESVPAETAELTRSGEMCWM